MKLFKKKTFVTETAIFGEVAQYCDHVSKMIIEYYKNKVTFFIWDHIDSTPRVSVEKYLTIKKAYKKYHEAIGRAVRGGWSLRELKSGNTTIFRFQYKSGTKGNYKGLD